MQIDQIKKYFLGALVALVGMFAALGAASYYLGYSYSYEVKVNSGMPTPEASATPEVQALSKESGSKPVNIILSPHFDDAVLSLGGFLAQDQGETEVDVFFAGKPSKDLHTEWDKMSGYWDSDEAVPLRILENKKVLGGFGAASKNYNYLDSQYREKGGSTSLTTSGQIGKSIEKDIESIISRYSSGEIYIYGPADFGDKITNSDHKILHEAFVAEAKKNKDPNVHFLMYEDLPYARQFSQSDSGVLKDYIEVKDSVKLKESDIKISQSELAEKTKGIGGYVSQVTAYKAQNTNIVSLAEDFNRERCKEIHSDWYACEIVYEIN